MGKAKTCWVGLIRLVGLELGLGLGLRLGLQLFSQRKGYHKRGFSLDWN